MYSANGFVAVLVTLAIIPAGLLAAEEKCFSDDTGLPGNVDPVDVNWRQLDFSIHLLRLANNLSDNSNVFFSPHSIYHALLMSFFMSRNSTLKNLKRILNFDDSFTKTQLYDAYAAEKTKSAMSPETGVFFKSLNRIYVAEELKIRDCMRQMFADELQSIDFSGDFEQARLTINEWVSNNTNEMIPELLSKGNIDSTTQISLVNAAYFKGVWLNPFDTAATRTDLFTCFNKPPVLTRYMNLSQKMMYKRDKTLWASILEIPYSDNSTSMFVVLPLEVKQSDFDKILEQLSDKKRLYDIFEKKNFVSASISLSLPKFTVERELQFRTILEKLDFFKKSGSDFSDLTGQNDVQLTDGVHKAKITVNEEGSEAAASTSLVMFRSSVPVLYKEFKCNRPFVYFIYDSESRRVLFQGIFREPAPFKEMQ